MRSVREELAVLRWAMRVSLICGWLLVGMGTFALGQDITPKPQGDFAMDSIRKTVTEKGVVRVIVKVPYTSLGMSPQDKEAELKANKKEVIAQMQGQGALLIEPVEGQPFIVMELNSKGVDHILELQLVESIHEDTLSQPFQEGAPGQVF